MSDKISKEVSVKLAYELYQRGEYTDAAMIYKDLGDIYGRHLFEMNIRLCNKYSLKEKKEQVLVGKTILFVSDHTYLPYRSGGRESSINDLAEDFSNAGWNVYVVVKKSCEKVVRRGFRGYSVIEVDDVFGSIIGLAVYYDVDRIVASVDGANISKFLSFFPSGSCLFVRDAQGLDHLSESDKDDFAFVSNSDFTAREVEKKISSKVEVYPPLIDIDSYKVTSSRKYVLFVNTVEKKGLSMAIDIAKNLPNVYFLFREGWPLSDSQWKALEDRIRDIHNIKLERLTHDVKSIYGDASLLIVPSQWEEAWGRVVTEAQVSGIPTIVNGVGGLPESCGEGGVVMPRSSTSEEWSALIERVLSDKEVYKSLSEGAIRQTENYKKQVAGYRIRFEKTIQPSKDRLNILSDEAVQVARKIKDGVKVRDLLSLDRDASITVKTNRVIYVFELFYQLQMYSMAIFVYEENVEVFAKSNDFVFALAQCYAKSKRYIEASEQWAVLYNSDKYKATPYQIRMYADSLFYAEKYFLAKDIYSVLLEMTYKDDGWLYRGVITAVLSSDKKVVEKFRVYCDNYSGDNGVFQKYVTLIFLSNGDYDSALKSFAVYLKKCEKCEVEDYALGVYLALRVGDYDFALQLSEDASYRFPKTYKGPEVPEALKKLECHLLDDGLHCKERSNKLWKYNLLNISHQKKQVICSWPGLLYGNRFMDLFRKDFVDQGFGFLPINMPSSIIVSDAKILIIQWPDILRWRNSGVSLVRMKELMKNELQALKSWKNNGVSLVWLVHNLIPHDLLDEEIPVWQDFFNSIGFLVDRYVSMSKNAKKQICEAIPSLRNKRYDYFYHPLYEVKKFKKEVVDNRREELGIKKDDYLVVSLGMIGRYKGIYELIQGFLLVKNPKSKLLIAGRSRDMEISRVIQDASLKDNRIIVLDQYIADDEFDLLGDISDLIVVPNKDYLNSGALIYAISAKKPVMALNRPFAAEMSSIFGDDSPIKLVDSFEDDKAIEIMSSKSLANANYDLEPIYRRSASGIILN